MKFSYPVAKREIDEDTKKGFDQRILTKLSELGVQKGKDKDAVHHLIYLCYSHMLKKLIKKLRLQSIKMVLY